MMIQSAPAGEPRFVCTMQEHNGLCGQFVRAFGNDAFERPEPFDEMVYVVSHHDRGWDDADADPPLDPKSRLPCGVGNASVPGGMDTTRKSPDFNERHQAYCGLLASMHCWGLYNARYGVSDFRVRPGGSTSVPIDPKFADETNAILASEVARQQRLKAELAADPVTRPWVEEGRLMQNYKLLQFFDTLALYFHLRHETERGEEVLVHVPSSADADTSVTVRPLGDGVYGLTPFPFAGDRLETSCRGWNVSPFAQGEEPDDLGATLRALPAAKQDYTLVAG